MVPGDVDDVPAVLRKPHGKAGFVLRIQAVVLHVDAVLDDADAVATEPIDPAECPGAEADAGVDFVSKRIEEQAVDGAARRRHHIGVVPAMLGKDELGPRPHQHLGQRGVEERTVLMGVEHLDATLAYLFGEPPTDGEVPSRLAVEADDFHTLALQFLADGSDAIQTENGGHDARTESGNGLADEHLRTGHLHHMDDEPNSDGLLHVVGCCGWYGTAGVRGEVGFGSTGTSGIGAELPGYGARRGTT